MQKIFSQMQLDNSFVYTTLLSADKKLPPIQHLAHPVAVKKTFSGPRQSYRIYRLRKYERRTNSRFQKIYLILIYHKDDACLKKIVDDNPPFSKID